jgi:hypothetical protein
MVWDKAEPQNTTKLRNLGIVIRPNWDAIEDGDATFKPVALNLNNRTPLAVPNDPTAIAETVILYTKDDASGNPQLNAIDQSSTITKLTGGSSTQSTNGKLLLPNGLTLIWGNVSITSSWVTYAFSGAFTFATAGFSITGNGNGSTSAIGFQNLTTTGFDAKASSGSPSITYIAIGN